MRAILKITDELQEAKIDKGLIHLIEEAKNRCQVNGCHNPKFTNHYCTRHMPI